MKPYDDGLHVFVSDLEVRLIRFSLADMLRAYGIDPTKPYTQRDQPLMMMHEFIQEWRYVLPTHRAKPPT